MGWTSRGGFRKATGKKYGNRSCECAAGHKHDSRGEAGYCDQLAYEKLAGEIESYKTQVTYRLDVNGKHICSHRVDFQITLPDGKTEVREYKGMATPEWSVKHKLFEACYPDIPYKVIWAKGWGR